MNTQPWIKSTGIITLLLISTLLFPGCRLSFATQPEITSTPLPIAATSWQDFPITDFEAMHSPVDGDVNEHLILGAISIAPPANDLDPSLTAFLGRWEGFDYAPPVKKDHKGVIVIQEITAQGGKAFLWAATNLQYPYWVKEIHFRVIPGEIPLIEWQGDASGSPQGASGPVTFTFAVAPNRQVLVGGINASRETVLNGSTIMTRDKAFHVYKDYAGYLESKRIYSKQYINTELQKYGAGYLVYLPDDYESKPEKNWPLILFLHGTGDRGDNALVIAKASPYMMIREKSPLPCIIIAPLLNNSVQYRSFPHEYMDGVFAEILDIYRVDHKRIYLTGVSMGGEATYRFVLHDPHTFAAIAPLAGFDARFFSDAIGWGFEPSIEPLSEIKDLPVWAIHGAKDTVIPLSAAQSTVDALKQAGADVRFTVLEDHDHDVWTDTYSDPQFYDWLLQHQLP